MSANVWQRDWPDARAEKWGNWVCGEQGNLLRSPVSIHRVFTQSEGAQQWGYHPLFVPVNTSHHCGSLPEFCCEFTSQTGRTRCAIQQTELGQLTPVSPRPKSRFMNLSATLNWAGMVLWHLSHPHSASRKIITTSEQGSSFSCTVAQWHSGTTLGRTAFSTRSQRRHSSRGTLIGKKRDSGRPLIESFHGESLA